MSLFRQFFGSTSNSWIRALIIFVLTWALLVYVFVNKLNTQTNADTDTITVKRINQALQLLEYSKQRNEELRQMIEKLSRWVKYSKVQISSECITNVSYAARFWPPEKPLFLNSDHLTASSLRT